MIVRRDIIRDCKYITISWSGGVDSSHILDKALKALNDETEPVEFTLNVVSATYTKDPRLMWEFEKRARKQMIGYFKEKYPKAFDKQIVRFHELPDEVCATVNRQHEFQPFEGSLAQPYMWITKILSLIQGTQDIIFGYHKGDDFWTQWPDFKELIEVSAKIFGATITPVFPLAFMYKEDIIRVIDPELLRMASYCENPSELGIPCDGCASCKLHNKALRINEMEKSIEVNA